MKEVKKQNDTAPGAPTQGIAETMKRSFLISISQAEAPSYGGAFALPRREGNMAKGKYQQWLEPDGLIRIAGWARDGLTDEQIAQNMRINVATLYAWKNKYSKISEVLKESKDVADRQVENALFERALGGTHEVSKTFKLKRVYYDDHNRRCEYEELVTGIDEVYIPPDTTAQIYWLKNRKRGVWNDADGKKAELIDAQVENLKATTAKTRGDAGEETEDDGFMDALRSEAAEIWQE